MAGRRVLGIFAGGAAAISTGVFLAILPTPFEVIHSAFWGAVGGVLIFLVGGFVAGLVVKQQGWLWGLITGALVVLIAAGFFSVEYGQLSRGKIFSVTFVWSSVLLSLFLNLASGALGGAASDVWRKVCPGPEA